MAVRTALALLVGRIAASAPRPLVAGHVRVGDIVADVAWQTGLRRDDITGPSRDQRLVRARDAVCWLAVDAKAASLPTIGRVLGGRDHSTIFAARRRAMERRRRDPAFARLTERLRERYRDLQED